jgi:tRNA U34 2-thiouridine synthase MnmA/TrmU
MHDEFGQGQCWMQIRNTMEPIPCTFERLLDGKLRVLVSEKEGLYGVAPGQAIALWCDDFCLGGGIIESAGPCIAHEG